MKKEKWHFKPQPEEEIKNPDSFSVNMSNNDWEEMTGKKFPKPKQKEPEFNAEDEINHGREAAYQSPDWWLKRQKDMSNPKPNKHEQGETGAAGEGEPSKA